MRRLRSAREHEVVVSIPGSSARTGYILQAPDRLAYDSNGGDGIQIGKRIWHTAPGLPWTRAEGDGLPFRTASWFRWTPYARAVRLLSIGKRTAVIALMDPGTPVWHRLTIDLASSRVRFARVITTGHYTSARYFAFDQPTHISAPHGN